MFIELCNPKIKRLHNLKIIFLYIKKNFQDSTLRKSFFHKLEKQSENFIYL